MMQNDRYTYRVTWLPDDEEYVGLCAEFPGLSWLASDQTAALHGIMQLVADAAADLLRNHEEVPEPISTRKYSGKFTLHITPDLHRQLALEAAEAGVSLNRLAGDKLRRPF